MQVDTSHSWVHNKTGDSDSDSDMDTDTDTDTDTELLVMLPFTQTWQAATETEGLGS